MNSMIILDTITKTHQSEQEEALIRSQTMLLINRNTSKKHIIKKVLKRFQRCIKKL